MIRLATTNDIPRLLELLHQVNMVHYERRPDIFKPHYVISDVDDRDYVSLLVKTVAESIKSKKK